MTLAHVLQRLLREVANGEVSQSGKTLSPLMGKVLKFVYDTVGRRLTIAELAQHFNYSVPHLKRLFKEGCGIPLGRFIHHTKLNAAQRMLSGSTRRIGEIAYSLGYESIPSFSLAFKKYTGKSPRQFRKDDTLKL